MKRILAFCLLWLIVAIPAATLVVWLSTPSVALPLTAQPVMTPKVDNITGAAQVIDWEHSKLHQGDSYVATYSVTTANLDNQRTVIAFTTPVVNLGRVHVTFNYSSSDPADAILYEVPTITDATQGTEAVPLNAFRESTNTSGMQSLEAAPAANGSYSTYNEAEVAAANIAATGTVIWQFQLGTGSGPFAQGGTSRGDAEVILASGTLYWIMLRNQGASANSHALNLRWYESIDGDFAN